MFRGRTVDYATWTGSLLSRNEEKAMYSRTTLLAAASLAVANTADTVNAAPMQVLQQPVAARELISARLHLHRYHLLSEPHFVGAHYVARSINPSGRVVLVEIHPKDGALIGEILI